MSKLKSIDIKGKSYVKVNERVKFFRSSSEFKGWALIPTEIETGDPEHIKFMVEIFNAEGRLIARAHAEEFRKDNPNVNRYGAIENAETSATGRALGLLGIGVDTDVATAEEIEGNITKMFDFTIEGLKNGEDKKIAVDYAQKRLKDTKFSSDQRREIMEAISKAKVSNTKAKPRAKK